MIQAGLIRDRSMDIANKFCELVSPWSGRGKKLALIVLVSVDVQFA